MVKMDKQMVRHIVEDLLPLYEEGLVSEETKKWLEEQLKKDENLRKLAQTLQTPLEKEVIPIIDEVKQEKTFKNIQRKLSLYQIIFVAISFVLAIRTSLLNESFGFILSYAILGFIIYLFYKDMKIVFYLSFIPIFLWSVIDGISTYIARDVVEGITLMEYVYDLLLGTLLISFIHYLFALIGSVIGFLLKKLFQREDIL